MLTIKQVRVNGNRVRSMMATTEIVAETKEHVDIMPEDLYYVEIEGKKYYFLVGIVKVNKTANDIVQEITLHEYGYCTRVSENRKITPLILLNTQTLVKEENIENVRNVRKSAGYL